MKTVGERIRQAREFRKMSGEELAQKAGYKHQSGISNLENRATGRGGFGIQKIAEALDVPIEWLINGPDVIDIRTVGRFSQSNRSQIKLVATNEKNASKDGDWPFTRITKDEWQSIPPGTRRIIEVFARSALEEITGNESVA
jgi:transcriptional regulator with XRE-family HTH domain